MFSGARFVSIHNLNFFNFEGFTDVETLNIAHVKHTSDIYSFKKLKAIYFFNNGEETDFDFEDHVSVFVNHVQIQ